MIEFRQISEVLHEEVRLLEEKAQFPDGYNKTYFRRLPDVEALANVIEEVFWASLMSEEGRACCPRLLFVPENEQSEYSTARWFADPIPLNKKTLAKLFLVCGPLGHLLWCCRKENLSTPILVGFCPFLGDSSQYSGSLHLSLSCQLGKIQFSAKGHILLSVTEGKLVRFSHLISGSQIVHVYMFSMGIATSECSFYAYSIMKKIREEGHGGALWFVKEEALLEGNIKLNSGIKMRKSPRAVREMFREYEKERHYLGVENRRKYARSISHLAAVDGAVILDASLQVQSFGAFINDNDGVQEFLMYDHNEKKLNRKPIATIGGGRHRSAVSFCNEFRGNSFALVVSQDGRGSGIFFDPKVGAVVCYQLLDSSDLSLF